MIELSESMFEEAIKLSPVVLVEFGAVWCAPCKVMEPLLVDLEKTLDGSCKIYKVDVDKAKGLKGKFNIKGVPLFILFKDGVEVKRATGSMSKARLTEFVKI